MCERHSKTEIFKSKIKNSHATLNDNQLQTKIGIIEVKKSDVKKQIAKKHFILVLSQSL